LQLEKRGERGEENATGDWRHIMHFSSRREENAERSRRRRRKIAAM